MLSDERPKGEGSLVLKADVVIDIQTRAIGSLFTYTVPASIEVEVGCAVRVTFGHQQTVGFVCGLVAVPEEEVRSGKLKPIEEVLSSPLFSEAAVDCARFLAKRYIAPLSACLRLFFPAGAAPSLKRIDGVWETILPKTGSAEETWIVAGPQVDSFVPRKGARRQEVVLAAVRQGDIRRSELRFLYGDVAAAVKALAKAGAVKVEKRRRLRRGDEPSVAFAPNAMPKMLTDSQKKALSQVEQAMDDDAVTTVLIDGVTGSGKTEVYLQAIEGALKRGQGAIVLVPEISLTPQTVTRFRSRFGDQVAVMHSKMSPGERYDQWDLLRCGAARIVVGARSALFMPVQNLGLIIVDEEHETTYKQESAPRYVTRDVACWMARQRSCTVVLGSATPSIESLYHAKHDPAWTYARLPERANGRPLPKVEVVDMAVEFHDSKGRIFSKKLANAIREELSANHKVVLLLNQRGFARFLLCRDCGFVPECRHCSTTLTFHEEGNKLVCHHCGYTLGAPPVCPSCQSPYLKRYGVGTQRVEAELKSLLSAQEGLIPGIAAPASEHLTPQVIRMDADTTAAKGAHQRLLEQFATAPAAVLLGTQMIAKGLDFDDVTLVGVINADTMLHLPDFRSSERTFDLIQQVAGRAGRAELPGRVFVQTYEADSVAIASAAAYDRPRFLANELPKRKALRFPPYARMANILLWGKDGSVVRRAAEAYRFDLCQHLASAGEGDIDVLPAAPCAFERIRNLIRWHVVVKCSPEMDISEALEGFHRKRGRIQGVSTAVDVDPMDLL